jgi:hypothetical protein
MGKRAAALALAAALIIGTGGCAQLSELRAKACELLGYLDCRGEAVSPRN